MSNMKDRGPASPTKKNYNRNRSFGGGVGNGNGGPPVSPRKGNNQPARRSVSHDAQTIRKQFAEDEGFAVIGEKRKGGGGGRGGDKAPTAPPRGRVNPTSSFTRPRNVPSFNKKRQDMQPSPGNGRTRSFNKPRPTGSFNSNASSKKDFKRTNSRVTSKDVELYQSGDGFNRAQRNIVRITQDTFLQARLLYLDPPDFGKSEYNWSPHQKCLWNDPTRRDQIEQVMMQYPNAIPLSMKKRTRIVSSKLGDAALSNDDSFSAGDDASSLGASQLSFSERLGSSERPGQSERTGPLERQMTDESFTFGMGGQEDMNPLRKTLLLLNKLSWTTIDRLTPKLFDVLEKDVPKMMKSTTAPPATILTPATVSESVDSSPQENKADSSSKQEDKDPGKDSNHSQKSQKQEDEISPMVVTILTLIVEKAQTEPHFSAMYAQLCKNLADRNKLWKRKILAHCQSEFEHDIAYHTRRLDERLMNSSADDIDKSSNTNATNENERDYLVLQLRQKYLGHVQFIGELFKLKLIKLDIMIWCLSRLLFSKDHVDEDDLECFAKLMTTVGAQAESLVKKGKCHAVAEEKWHQCWDRVYFLTGRKKKQSSKQNAATEQKEEEKPPKISSRIKFMLVDLLELEENDWVHRRTKEKPKTLAEIHEEVREEEAQARRRSNSDDFFNRGRSNSNDSFTMSPQYMSRKVPKQIDADGFSVVSKKNTIVRRAVSDVEVSDIYSKNSNNNKRNNSLASKKDSAAPQSPTSRSRTVLSQMNAGHATPKIVEYPDPQECKEKTKILLKEYFVGGDTEEAIRCIDELVGAGTDTEGHSSVDRGAAVIETGVLLVLEMKQQEVQKFLAVIKRCLQKKKIEKECLAPGLNDPLEFLNDVEIDAPLARSLLTNIVSYWVRQEVIPLDFLLEAPEYFRTDGKAAEFAAGVVKMRGGEASDGDLTVIEKLMTEDDKKKYGSPKDLLGS